MSQSPFLNEYGVSDQVKSRQLAVVTALTFIALLALLGALLALVYWVLPEKADGRSEIQMAQAGARIQRIGTVDVQGGAVADASTATAALTAEGVYNSTCAACHSTGVAGAPKVGDASAWAARIGQGEATLFKHAIEGFTGATGVMPARGGSPTLSDEAVKAAVVYMANQSGAQFAEIALSAAASADSGESAAATAVVEPEPAADAPATGAEEAPAAAAALSGEALYKQSCQLCHGAGIAGAPKFGDKAAWASRVAQGEATLFQRAIDGFTGSTGVMPARGGSTASDEEVKEAVRYMIAAVQ